MGVEYCHYLLPRPNGFFPSADQLSRLIDQLVENHWLPAENIPNTGMRGASPRALATISHRSRDRQAITLPFPVERMDSLLKRNTRLKWEIENPPALHLKYPLFPLERFESLDEMYYDIGLEWSPNYVYRTSDCCDPFQRVVCQCGSSLEFEGDDEEGVLGRSLFSSFILSTCPDCGSNIEIANWPATIRNGFNGNEALGLGGASSRFALIVDCGKSFPGDSPMHADTSLIELLRGVFGCDWYEFGDFY